MMLVWAMHRAVLLVELQTTAALIVVLLCNHNRVLLISDSPNSASVAVAFLRRNSVSHLVRSYHLSSCLNQPFFIQNYWTTFLPLTQPQHNLRFTVIPLHHPLSACSPCAGLHHIAFFFSMRLTFLCPVNCRASWINVVCSFEGTCILPHNANLRAFARTLKMRSA